MTPCIPTVSTTTTNATGNYIFDNLPAGIYVVRITAGTSGYTQTGDPDHFGTTWTTMTKTTTPIVLAPGDVFVNADFGYQPDDGRRHRSATRSGSMPTRTAPRMADEYRHPWRDGGPDQGCQRQRRLGCRDEPIIATDITDADGLTCSPACRARRGTDYLVWVNDTDNVLAPGRRPTTATASATRHAGQRAEPGTTCAGNLRPGLRLHAAGQTAGEGPDRRHDLPGPRTVATRSMRVKGSRA